MSSVSKRNRAFRTWMNYRPVWTPEEVPSKLKADKTPLTEPLSKFLKELPEQIGFFLVRDVWGWEDEMVAEFASKVRKKQESWPHPHGFRVSPYLVGRFCDVEPTQVVVVEASLQQLLRVFLVKSGVVSPKTPGPGGLPCYVLYAV